MPISARDFFRQVSPHDRYQAMPIQFRDGVEVVDCPCCKGKRVLQVITGRETTPFVGPLCVFDGIERDVITESTCTHCMGKGYVPAK